MIIVNGEILDMKHYIIRSTKNGEIVDTIVQNPDIIDELWDMYVANCTEGKLELIDYDLGITIKDYEPSIDNR